MLSLLATVPLARAAELPAPIARAFIANRVPVSGVSIYIESLADSAPILAHLADVPRNPASAMKLLPTLAALETLGPAYTWKTQAYSAAPLKNGRLEGDLFLKGYGDPYLVTENFWGLLQGLRRAGVKEIAGDLVLDLSYLKPNLGDESFDGEDLRAYNAHPSALLLNFQSVKLRFVPDAHALNVYPEPASHHLRVDNRVRLVKGPCRGWSRDLQLKVVERGDGDVVRLGGRYPSACGEREMFRVVSKLPRYVHGVFKAAWEEQGGRFLGEVREAVLPENARLLYQVESRPLAEIVRGINKFSNNVMTRQLVLTLGAERFGPPGTVENGLAAVRQWLLAAGESFPELVLENGAGLSRNERISARHLVAVLNRGYRSPYMPEYLASLPLAGADGTLARRFGATALAANLRAKTGSLDGVRSLAGYLRDRNGRLLAIAIVHNDASADRDGALRVQEAILDWAYGAGLGA